MFIKKPGPYFTVPINQSIFSAADENDEEIDEEMLKEILEGLPGVNLDEVKKNFKK